MDAGCTSGEIGHIGDLARSRQFDHLTCAMNPRLADGSRNIPLNTLAAGLMVCPVRETTGLVVREGHRTFSPKAGLIKLTRE
jgi:hypothetical protein